MFRSLRLHPTPVQLGPGRLLAVTALSAAGSTGYGLLSPAVAELANTYQVSETAVGLLQGAVAVPGIALTMVIGALADRLGHGRVALASLLLFSVAGTACVAVDSFGLAVALRVLQGIGFAGLLTIPPAVIGERLDGATRQRALAVNTLVLTTASTLGPVIGALLASTGDPRHAFWTYAAAIVLVPSTVLILGLSRGSARTEPARPGAVVAALRQRGALPTVVGALGLSTITLWFIAATTTAVLPLALDRVYDVPLVGRGIYIGLANVGSLGASAILAVLAGRVADRHLAIAGIGLICASMWTLASGPPLWLVVIAMLALGTGVSCAYNTCLHQIARQDVPGRGLLVGAWSASSRLGQATGPLLGAGLVVLLNPLASFAVGGAVGVAVLIGLVALTRGRTVGRRSRSAPARRTPPALPAPRTPSSPARDR